MGSEITSNEEVSPGRLHEAELFATRPFDLHPPAHTGHLHHICQQLTPSDLHCLDGGVEVLDIAGVESLRAIITGQGHCAVDPGPITGVDQPVVLIFPLLGPPSEHRGQKLDRGSGIRRIELEVGGSDSQTGSSR